MSNLAAIERKLKDRAPQQAMSTPTIPKKKSKREEECPKCQQMSMMQGFCMVCGFESKE